MVFFCSNSRPTWFLRTPSSDSRTDLASQDISLLLFSSFYKRKRDSLPFCIPEDFL